jgi:ribonucleoside-diphosphate reductase alpha chain
MARVRTAKTFSFTVADCHGYFTVGEYEDGAPGELFVSVAKMGSTLAGLMDSFARSISYGLQYGVPLKVYVKGMTSMSFAPSGITDDADIRTASSLIDYIFRRLALSYLSFDDRLELGLASFEDMPEEQTSFLEEPVVVAPAVTVAPASVAVPAEPIQQPVAAPVAATPVAARPASSSASSEKKATRQDDAAPMCFNCGNQTQKAGSCYVCTSCGSTTGCS